MTSDMSLNSRIQNTPDFDLVGIRKAMLSGLIRQNLFFAIVYLDTLSSLNCLNSTLLLLFQASGRNRFHQLSVSSDFNRVGPR